MNKKTTEQRFWEKVNKDGPVPERQPELGPCWIWTGSKRNKGYGAFVFSSGSEVVQGRAHRYSWQIHNGPIPDALSVLHKCDNPPCVNPDHLFLGTIADNNRDILEKGRHVRAGTYGPGQYKRGTAHHAAKLTEELVKEIRELHATGRWSYSQLGARFGINRSAAYKIVKRLHWKQVT